MHTGMWLHEGERDGAQEGEQGWCRGAALGAPWRSSCSSLCPRGVAKGQEAEVSVSQGRRNPGPISFEAPGRGSGPTQQDGGPVMQILIWRQIPLLPTAASWRSWSGSHSFPRAGCPWPADLGTWLEPRQGRAMGASAPLRPWEPHKELILLSSAG